MYMYVVLCAWVRVVALATNPRALRARGLLLISVLCFLFIAPQAHALTISGHLYSDEGATAITAGATITIAVGTTTPSIHTTTSDGSGLWIFDLGASHEIVPSTPILIYVDNDPASQSVRITKASSTNDIPNLNLYRHHVIVAHEGTSGTSTTIADMSFYDNDNDSDIPFTASSTTNTLTVYAGTKLYVDQNKTFAPGGSVTVRGGIAASSTDGSLHIAAGATYIQGGATTLAGNFTA